MPLRGRARTVFMRVYAQQNRLTIELSSCQDNIDKYEPQN